MNPLRASSVARTTYPSTPAFGQVAGSAFEAQNGELFVSRRPSEERSVLAELDDGVLRFDSAAPSKFAPRLSFVSGSAVLADGRRLSIDSQAEFMDWDDHGVEVAIDGLAPGTYTFVLGESHWLGRVSSEPPFWDYRDCVVTLVVG